MPQIVEVSRHIGMLWPQRFSSIGQSGRVPCTAVPPRTPHRLQQLPQIVVT
ncbi:MAG: hypothetical protein H6656_06490 [Ardenticatenaceae bacterium]|nr:hypothetical protein [Ardenticatenaceae bacterium]